MTQIDLYKKELENNYFNSSEFNIIKLGCAWSLKYFKGWSNGDKNSKNFLLDIFSYLKENDVTSISVLTVGIYGALKDTIENIHFKYWPNSKIDWLNPFDDIHEISTSFFEEMNCIEGIILLARFSCLLLMSKRGHFKVSEPRIQFIKDLIYLTDYMKNKRDPFFNFQLFSALIKETIPENKNTTQKNFVTQLPNDTINIIIGNGMLLDTAKKMNVEPFIWESSFKTLQENLTWFYEKNILNFKKIIKDSPEKQESNIKKIEDLILQIVQRKKEWIGTIKWWKMYLEVIDFIFLLRENWIAFILTSKNQPIYIDTKETAKKWEKYLKNETKLADLEFIIRDLTATYIYSTNIIDIFFGNMEVLQMGFDKLAHKQMETNIYNDSIYSAEFIMEKLYKYSLKFKKISENFEFSVIEMPKISKVLTINYEASPKLFFNNVLYVHGMFDETFILDENEKRREKKIIKVIKNDLAWNGRINGNLNTEWNTTYSTIYKASDYKLRHITSITERFADQKTLDRTSYQNLTKINDWDGNVLIYGTTLKYDLHILESLNPLKINKIFISYHNNKDIVDIEWIILRLKQVGFKEENISLIKSSKISQKFLVTKK